VLPEGNKITTGAWWGGSQTNLVSVEQQLAKSLKIKLGDVLTYSIGSQQFKATVSSIRYLNWDTMKPNFYMIFSPGTLNAFPSTYITSFYLPKEKKHYLNDLLKSYPSVTVVEVDLILRQIKTILAQITESINYMLIFALLAGFTVLFASVYATLDNRIYDGTLLRTLGAKRRLLRWSQFIEFSILGLIASLLAVIIAEIITYFLYSHVLHLDYHVQWLLLAFIPLCGSLFVGFAGCWGVRDVVNKCPMQVLRQL
jgi:putative ABC transport system permease protein